MIDWMMHRVHTGWFGSQCAFVWSTYSNTSSTHSGSATDSIAILSCDQWKRVFDISIPVVSDIFLVHTTIRLESVVDPRGPEFHTDELDRCADLVISSNKCHSKCVGSGTG